MQNEEQMLSTLLSESSDNGGKSKSSELNPTEAAGEIASDTVDNDQSKAAASNTNPAANSPELSWQSDLLWALLNSSEFAMTP